MLPSVEQIMSRIRDGSLLSVSKMSQLNHDEILDARDRDSEFESRWLCAYNTIADQWDAAAAAGSLQIIEDIRRESFLIVSDATSQHGIASYVSDDLEMIARGVVLGIDLPFVQQLWETYSNNEIPRPRSGDW